MNILANEETRVVLQLTSREREMGETDYINANFVRGYDTTKPAYICTQGPLDRTTGDFWRMMWERRCHVVVMITNLIAEGRVKCHKVRCRPLLSRLRPPASATGSVPDRSLARARTVLAG